MSGAPVLIPAAGVLLCFAVMLFALARANRAAPEIREEDGDV